MSIKCLPVTRDRWSDLERLFESRGGPHYCWCMACRVNENDGAGKAGKKAALKARVIVGVPIGLLAYSNGEPVAWCSVGPRDSFRPLGGDETLKDVWSLVCFFVKRAFRGKGITSLLIEEAVDFASRNGARYLEVYPADEDSPSYGFMGRRGTFERAGFRYCRKAGKRRNVMLRELTRMPSNKRL